MTHPKKPASKAQEPGYPSLRCGKLDRRRFLSLIGGGAATSVLVSACYQADDETGKKDESTSDTDTGYRLGGEPPEPHYFDRRLPAEGFAHVRLADAGQLAYAITAVFEDKSFREMPEPDLLDAVNERLAFDFAVRDLESEQGLEEARKACREALTEAFEETYERDPAFIEVELTVESLHDSEDNPGVPLTPKL